MSSSMDCCPVVYRVLKWLWMDDSPLSGGAGFLISDSDRSMSPTDCTLWTQPFDFCSLCPSLTTSICFWKACVCVYMGGGGWWWVVGKERKYDGDNGSIWFHIFAEFFISCLDLDFGNPKPNTLAFFSLVFS